MANLTFGKYTVEVSNTDKIFFPDEKLTKGDLIDYYRKISEVMLPYLKERPVTMQRFPEGIKGEGFYHKDAPDYFPDWIRQESIKKKEGGKVNHVICENVATLVYLADQACITPHVWLSRVEKLDYPDRLIFDLDPPGDDFAPVRFAATSLRDLLSEELGLTAFVMTTGSRGLHLAVALDGSENFDTVRAFAQEAAKTLAQRHPERLTTHVRKEKREGRLFLDTARNAYGQTAVAPYAVRPQPGAPVATPLQWEELSDKDLLPQSYNVQNIFRRLGQKPDPWQDINKHASSIKKAQERLDALKK